MEPNAQPVDESETPTIDIEPEKKPFNFKPWLKWLMKVLAAFGLIGGTASGGTFLYMKPVAPDVPFVELIVKDVKGKPHEFLKLSAETTGAKVRWRSITPGLTLMDYLPDLVANKEAIAVGCAPGIYYVECWSAISNAPTAIYTSKVTIGDPQPDPVPPGPGPTPPTPPNPNPPTPVPPAPTSELAKKLQKAYDADPAAINVKTIQKDNLRGLYLAMVDHAANKSIVNTSDLLADLKAASASMVPATALIEMRKVNAAEIAAALGNDTDTKLDPDYRPKAIDVFGRIAKSLGEVK